MISAELLTDAFERVKEAVHDAVDGLTRGQLAVRLDDRANSIAWLVWHLTRVQDDHVCDLAVVEQVWTADGWVDRFGLPFHAADTGFGHHADEVTSVRVGADLLTGYYDAVHARTLDYVQGLSGPDLDRVVDEAWTPPVTLGVRLISVISDDLQHAGQAAFLRGMVLRRG